MGVGYRSGGSLAARSGQLRTMSARISSSTSIESNDSISRRMAASSSVESTRPRKMILEVCKLDCVYYTSQQFLLGTFASARGILNGNDKSV
jgi:hypothetical protein